jgi:hypothetical protein
VSISAVFYSARQTGLAVSALQLNQQVSRAQSVIHFTNRFFDLVEKGEPCNRFNDQNWIYQFWSLHATEFYFFHHGIIPTFMYSLWMIDLAALYDCSNGPAIRETHKNYLESYSLNYIEMIEFYHSIYEIARDCDDVILRNRKVSRFVMDWIGKNKGEILP